MTDLAVVTLTADDARKLTERIRYTALSVRDGMEKLQRLVQEAKDGNAHEALGYASWTAYLSDTLGSEPLRLPRDQRQELVGYLAGEGMSIRSIAPVVGVSKSVVGDDLQVSGNRTPAETTRASIRRGLDDLAAGATRRRDDLIVDHDTGEILDVPEPRKVTGLDGKSYSRPESKAKHTETRMQPSAELTLINDVRIYLRALATSSQVAALGAAARAHLIDALQNTIDSLKGMQP